MSSQRGCIPPADAVRRVPSLVRGWHERRYPVTADGPRRRFLQEGHDLFEIPILLLFGGDGRGWVVVVAGVAICSCLGIEQGALRT